jgi:excisionase family DNA binding protein
MESRKRASNPKNGSIKKKLDKLAEDIKKLPQDRKEKLKELIRNPAYTTKEAADRLGVSFSTVRRLMKTGEFKFFRVGNSVRIASSEVDRFFNMVTLKEASGILGVHEITIRRLIKSGKLPSFRIGRCYRIDISDIEKIMQEDTQNAKK